MYFFSSKKKAATSNIEQPTLSPAAPLKMNFYIERDSLIESKVKETESDDENTNNKRQKTNSDSFIKKNGNIEKGSVRKDFECTENAPLGLESFPSASFPTSNNKDLENDANRQTHNYADRISKILSRSNTKEKSITSLAGNYNKTFINFVKPAEQVETSSKQVKARTDQLFIEKNDCTNHLDRTTQAVNQIVECNDKKVDLANKAFTYNEKQNKTGFQWLCECPLLEEKKVYKERCLVCSVKFNYKCRVCFKLFKRYKNALKHVCAITQKRSKNKNGLMDKNNIFSAEIATRIEDFDSHDSVTEIINNNVLEKENVLNTYTMEADVPNVQHYDVQYHQNVHIETKTAYNVQSKNVKSKQNVQIEHRNMPNLQQYNVQNYGNVDIKKENAVQNSDVQIGASNSYENNFNVIKNNSNNSLSLNFPYTNTEDLENLQIEDVNIPNIEQYYPQIQGNFDIKKENVVQNHDVQIRASNSYENHFTAIRNNSDNSLLLNSSITTTENLLCLSCGLKSDDNFQLLEYHRLYGCLKTQSQTPINVTKPSIIVHCFNCNLSYQHFNGRSPKRCSRCTDGEVRFICGSCRCMHSSFTFIKDHTEQRECLRYVALPQFPYPQFPFQQQFHSVNFNAPISYPHMYPTNYATYQ